MENGQKSTVRCAVDQNGPSRKTVGYGTVRYGHGQRINSDSLLYKPCTLTSLDSRKSWDIFALSSGKIDFFIFAYFNLRVHLKALITSGGYIR
jgi:hypothetical protein